MHRLPRFLLSCLLLACALPASATPYGDLLATHVRDGEQDGIRAALVDYNAWAKDKTHAEAMKALAETKPERLNGPAETAFWINAYNLLVVDLVVTHPGADSIRHVGSVLDDPWKSFSWTIAGKSYTLGEIEQRAVRSKPNDMRVYLALCNGSLSAPDLAATPYEAASLDAQLDTQTKRFLLNTTKGLYPRGTVLEVSRLFKPLTVEFEAGGGLVAFIRRYVPQVPPQALVQGYFMYNWALNGTPVEAEGDGQAPAPTSQPAAPPEKASARESTPAAE